MYTISRYSFAEKCMRTRTSIAICYIKSGNCTKITNIPPCCSLEAEKFSDAKLIKIIFWWKIIKKCYFSNFSQKCIAQMENFSSGILIICFGVLYNLLKSYLKNIFCIPLTSH